MKQAMIKYWFVILLLLLFCTDICASGLSYADNQPFPAGYTNFRNVGALSLPLYPFAISKNKFSIQTAHRSLYGLKELADNQFGCTVRFRDFTFGGAGAVFGEPEYYQQTGFSIFGNYLFNGFTVGITAIYKRMSFNETYSDISHTAINLGISKSYNSLLLYSTGRNINRPEYYAGSTKLPLEAECGVSYLSKSSLDSQFSLLFREEEKPMAMAAQSFLLDKRVALNWSLVFDPIRFGGGINFKTSHLGFNYKVSHHPVLGMTHTILMSVFIKNENLTD